MTTDPPTKATIGSIIAARRARGLDVISLGLGDPHFSTPLRVREAAARSALEDATGYDPGPGQLPLRDAVSRYLRTEHELAYAPDDIIITPGTKQALFMALMATLGRDGSAVYWDPAYVSIRPMLEIVAPGHEHRAISVLSEGEPTLEESLAEAIGPRTKVLLVNSPHNPTGWIMDTSELRCVADAAVDRDLWIISDEVYSDLWFDHVPQSIGSDPRVSDRTITVGGFGKTHAIAGWRSGFMAAPTSLRADLRHLHHHLHTNTSTIVQAATLVALGGGMDHLVAARRDLRENLVELGRLAADGSISLPVTPRGGMFAFVLLNNGMSGAEFSLQLAEKTGVVVAAGSQFGPAWARYMRISLAAPPHLFREAMHRIRAFLEVP